MQSAEQILTRWYAGEVGGNALFTLLAQEAPSGAIDKWQALAALEVSVGRRLLKALAGLGVRPAEVPGVAARAVMRVGRLKDASWEQRMTWLRHVAAEALTQMKREALELPADLSAVADLVLRHEEVLIEFADLELTGQGARSLHPVAAFLESYDAA